MVLLAQRETKKDKVSHPRSFGMCYFRVEGMKTDKQTIVKGPLIQCYSCEKNFYFRLVRSFI